MRKGNQVDECVQGEKAKCERAEGMKSDGRCCERNRWEWGEQTTVPFVPREAC